LRDVFSKNFQSITPFVWVLMFISFHQCGITGRIKFPLYGVRRLYVFITRVKNNFDDDVFSCITISSLCPPSLWRCARFHKEKAPRGFSPPGAHSLTAYLLILKQLVLTES
jgi:hypothetical protein